MTCPSCSAENDPAAETCFTCGRLLAAVIRRGTLVASRYEIIKPLGKGGMGAVYKARDCVFTETVAVKILRADLSQQAEMVRRFRTELSLAQRVRHPNVCRIHSSGEEGGRLYIVMDYVEGTELKTLLRIKGGLPPEQAFEIAIQLADGLQAVHDVGIVHRDVKSMNVMIDPRGEPKLMDFDVAKQWDAEAQGDLTQTGHVLATPEYMSPEYARGAKVDFRSDVYSLGIVVFELFTGVLPFRGETSVATIMKQLQESPPLEGPSAVRIPPAAVPVLRKALAKGPDRRYSTARGFAAALRLARATAAGPSLPPPARAEPAQALLGALNPVDSTVRIQLPKLPPKDPAASQSIPLLLDALERRQPAPVPPPTDMTLPVGSLAPKAIVPGTRPISVLAPPATEAEQVAVLVEALLKAPEGDDRARAARQLGGKGTVARQAIPVLLEALRDRESTVGVDAAQALERMGPEAADALAAAVNDDDQVVRRIAADALARILRRKRVRDA